MRKTSVTVSKWCAGIVSILGMILYICSAIFFYRFLQIDYKWADGIGWPGVIEYGLIFIFLAIALIYMHRVTRQYLRSEDRMIMHYAWIQSVMWVFQIWIPKFQRKTRGELPFMTANWLNNVMYTFQFVLIINIFMNKIKIENES